MEPHFRLRSGAAWLVFAAVLALSALVGSHTVRQSASLLVCVLVVSPASAQKTSETRVEEAIEQLKSPNGYERYDAAEALQKIGPKDEPCPSDGPLDDGRNTTGNWIQT